MPATKRPKTHLTVVEPSPAPPAAPRAAATPHPIGDSEVYNLMRKPTTTAERVKRLQLEAKMLAREQIEALEQQMRQVVAQAEEIANGGDAYPVGARELCRSMIEELSAKAATLGAIAHRN